MRRLALAILVPSPLLLISLGILNCGTGPVLLQSVEVKPAFMVANGSPVQFTATGKYSNGTTVTPLAALWSIPSPALIDQNGLASCNGALGNMGAAAEAPMDPRKALRDTVGIVGVGTMNCP